MAFVTMGAVHVSIDTTRCQGHGYARGQCPVARTEEGGGFWLVTRYDDVKRVLEDWEMFSSTESGLRRRW